jgi:dinuclear metal center YbgI/SA1388 family protein
MQIKAIIQKLVNWAPAQLQESYDNAGLITGQSIWECTGVLCTLDATEEVVQDAIEKGCNLLVAHHPILFKGIKSFSGNSYVERAIIKAIKNDIAIYAIHTNLDNVLTGVNKMIADKLGLQQLAILQPKESTLRKLYTYAPINAVDKVREALFEAGAGKIGLYDECSFNTDGTGTFRPLSGADPFIGNVGTRETLPETKIEVIFPFYLQQQVVSALFKAHPYETVAYEIIKLENTNQEIGSGVIGLLPEPMGEAAFLHIVKKAFGVAVIKHTQLLNRSVQKVALCGGSGSFLTQKAIAAGADIYITSDVKYHEFFDADGKLVLVDIGHWESEQFTTDLLANFLQQNFPTFAVLKTGVHTNPVQYLL